MRCDATCAEDVPNWQFLTAKLSTRCPYCACLRQRHRPAAQLYPVPFTCASTPRMKLGLCARQTVMKISIERVVSTLSDVS